MQQRLLLFALLPLLAVLASGCDALGEDEAEEGEEESWLVEGRWSSRSIGALVGECCGVRVDIREEDGVVSGSGVVTTPTERVGSIYKYPVEVAGSRSGDALSLDLTSGLGFYTGRFTGTYDPDINYGHGGVEGTFRGFGMSRTSLNLYPRTNTED